jgi:hypothetical protein
MAFPQQYEVHFPEDPSHAADAPWSAAGFPPPQHLQSASLYPCPLPGQLHGHAGIPRDTVVSNWHRDIPPQAFTRTRMLMLFIAPISECCW